MGLIVLFIRLVLAILLWTTLIVILYKFLLWNGPPFNPNSNPIIQSECSANATLYGGDQKVISFSLSEENGAILKEEYIRGIKENVEKVRKFYPGWLLRIYTDIPERFDFFFEYSNTPNLFICDVRNLPILGDVTNSNSIVWNFLPIGDPSVSIFIARDLTAVVSERESTAVSDWEKSDKVFHAMRDHPVEHFKEISAGLWGAKTNLINPHTRKYIQLELLKRSTNTLTIWEAGPGDELLNDLIYKNFKNFFMIHDSYHCEFYNDSIPFPQQRKDASDFVGNNLFVWGSEMDMHMGQCPPQCRPLYGKNWLYC